MSIAVVVKKDNKVVIGADTLQCFDSNMADIDNLYETKLRRIGPAILAGSGWGLYDNILDDYLKGKKPVRLSTKQQVFCFSRNYGLSYMRNTRLLKINVMMLIHRLVSWIRHS